MRELKAFRKVTVAANGTVTIDFTIPVIELSSCSPAAYLEVLQPGTFDFWVGTGANAPLHATFQVVN